MRHLVWFVEKRTHKVLGRVWEKFKGSASVRNLFRVALSRKACSVGVRLARVIFGSRKTSQKNRLRLACAHS